MKRTELARSLIPMKRTPLARVGRRAKQLSKERARVGDRVHRRDVTCRFWGFVHSTEIVTDPCAGPLDVHEIIPRSAWPAGMLDELNCVLLCRTHHDWVGDNPRVAHLVGLHGFSWERP